MAVINGTEGNDPLSGGADADTINGFGGNDFLAGNDGADSMVGGTGNDTIFGDAGNDWIEGSSGNDSISGGSGQDSYVWHEFGAANADLVTNFASGWDNLQLDAAAFTAIGASGRLASGDVRFFAGAGATGGHDADDRIVYDTSTGQLFYDADGSGAGAAQLIATFQGAPTIAAGDINVFGTATPPPPPGTINGTAGDDTLIGTDSPETINGFGGNDSIVGAGGADSLVGGDGNDTLDGLNRPTNGSSMGYTDVDVDTMDGGLGNDTYYVDNPADVLTDAGGIDTVVTQNTAWTLGPGFENLTVRMDDESGHGTGNELDNVLDGTGSFRVRLDGMGGNDLLIGGPGKDVLNGGDGNDTIMGGDFDTMDGGNGNDVLNAGPFGGGGGSPMLTGGAGADSFVFAVAPSTTADPTWITDFTTGTDKIRLDATVMPALGTTGNFAVSDPRFYAAAGATAGHDADDRIIYDTSSGHLFYDPDGSGSQQALFIAELHPATSATPAATLAATDFAVDNGTAPSGGGGTPPPPAGSIVGTEGNDSLSGTSGNDTIYGLGGNDFLAGNDGADSMVGGAGNDTIFGDSGNDWIEGSSGNDTFSGGSGQDSYVFRESGAANADLVTNFGSGWDNIQLDAAGFGAIGATGRFASGDVRFFAGAGATGGHDADDRIVYNTSTGQLFYDADGSGSGAAQLIATFQGAPGMAATDINVFGAATPPPPPPPGTINGTEGNDSLVGTSGNDTIFGFGGNDTIDGLAGADSMVGGDGDDRYFVDNAGDVVVEAQNGGVDEVRATINYQLSDWVNNLSLLDGAFSGHGNDIENIITGNAAGNALYGHAGNDTLLGGAGNDHLIGGPGNDSMSGGAGDDLFALDSSQLADNSTQGSDTVDGGDGFDFVGFSTEGVSSTAAVTVDLAAGTYSVADPAGTVNGILLNVEWVQGSSHDDLIVGNAAANRLDGFHGNDTLIGGAGNDILIGYGDARDTADLDVMDGGAGNDTLDGSGTYRFSVAPGAANADRINSIDTNDTIQLDAAVFANAGANGRLATDDARFYSAAGATAGHDADDRVVYNTSTGEIFYDADGSGAGAAQLFATLPLGATLAASQFEIINGGTPPPPPPPGTNDFISGTNGNDTLAGGAGNDTIYGNAGNDWIEGGTGNDTVSGGSGQDSYVFREYGAANADTVTSFDTAWDALRFDSSVFTALGGAGHFSSADARFYAAAGASAGHDGDDRIIYNTSTGQLYYDADGSGAGGAELVATLQGAPTVAAGDIYSI